MQDLQSVSYTHLDVYKRQTLDRVKKIMVEPDYQVWKEYAYRENLHPAILSYLELKNSCFYQMETTIDGKQFATPRGWEDLSRLMKVYEKLGKEITCNVVEQYIPVSYTHLDVYKRQ